MIRDIRHSTEAFATAIGLLTKPWAIKYVIGSAILSMLTAIIFVLLALSYGDNLGSYFLDLLAFSSGPEWLAVVVQWIMRILLLLSILFLFKYVVLVITSPIMSILSEKVEERYSLRETTRPGLKEQLSSIARGSYLALTNLTKEMIISIPIILVSLIPGIVIFATPVLFLVQSYFAGFGNFDFYLERHLNVRDSKTFAGRHKLPLVINGGVFLTILFIPIIGVLIAPALGTIAATLQGIKLMED